MSNRVTWLIPVKNGMPYVRATLASIEAQIYRNWEVLIWDNGSTDGTLEELKKWVPDRLPGRVVTDQPLGVGASRARMVEAAQTEFCASLDADDVCLPHRLEKQVSYLMAHPEVAVVSSHMYIMSRNRITDRLYTTPLDHDDIVHHLIGTNSLVQGASLFRRSAILDVGNYRDLPGVEDYDLWMRVAAKYKLACLDIPLTCYRLHDKSTTRVLWRQSESGVENKLQVLTDDCFVKNAPLLFGCTEQEARLLISRSHPIAIQTLFKIANYLHQTQGGTLLDRLCSDSFITVSKRYIAPDDVVSLQAIEELKRGNLPDLIKEGLKVESAK